MKKADAIRAITKREGKRRRQWMRCHRKRSIKYITLNPSKKKDGIVKQVREAFWETICNLRSTKRPLFKIYALNKTEHIRDLKGCPKERPITTECIIRAEESIKKAKDNNVDWIYLRKVKKKKHSRINVANENQIKEKTA